MKRILFLLLLLISTTFTSCKYVFAFIVSGGQTIESQQLQVDQVTYENGAVNILLYSNSNIFCYESGKMNEGSQLHYGNGSFESYLDQKQQQYGINLQLHIKTAKDCADDNLDAMMRIISKRRIMRYALENAENKEEVFLAGRQ